MKKELLKLMNKISYLHQEFEEAKQDVKIKIISLFSDIGYELKEEQINVDYELDSQEFQIDIGCLLNMADIDDLKEQAIKIGFNIYGIAPINNNLRIYFIEQTTSY